MFFFLFKNRFFIFGVYYGDNIEKKNKIRYRITISEFYGAREPVERMRGTLPYL